MHASLASVTLRRRCAPLSSSVARLAVAASDFTIGGTENLEALSPQILFRALSLSVTRSYILYCTLYILSISQSLKHSCLQIRCDVRPAVAVADRRYPTASEW